MDNLSVVQVKTASQHEGQWTIQHELKSYRGQKTDND